MADLQCNTSLDAVTSLADGKPVFGVACIDQLVFVLRRRTATVEIYDAETFQGPVGRLNVDGLRNPLDMASSPLSHPAFPFSSPSDHDDTGGGGCLYILDGLEPSGKVYKVRTAGLGNGREECSGTNVVVPRNSSAPSPRRLHPSASSPAPSSSSSSLISSWSVGDVSMNVSVESTSMNVLVTCGQSKQLREFDCEGHQLRVVSLHVDIVSPQHAVQLQPNTGRYVVCHGWMDDKLHRVCVVDSSSSDNNPPPPVAVFGSARGFGLSSSGSLGGRLLHNPSHLAIDPPTGTVFVADMGNRRVAALQLTAAEAATGRSLTLVGEGRVDDRKRLPSRLCLDSSRRRLYVAYNEWKDVFWTCGGVTVFHVTTTGGGGGVGGDYGSSPAGAAAEITGGQLMGATEAAETAVVRDWQRLDDEINCNDEAEDTQL